MNRQALAQALAVVAIGLTAANCGAAGNKAGGQPTAITLKAAVGEPRPAQGGREQMAIFKAKVEALSGGAMKVDITYGVGGDDWEPGVGNIVDTTVVRKVRDGTYDLAWVPARSWDVEALGIKTLRPVSAPFLVDSNALAAKIATGPIATELMAGLSDLDIIGLALVPDRLRHPVGFDEPLLGTADFVGKTLRVPNSATTHALFKSLGAEPVDPPNFRELIGTREIVGADAGFNSLGIYPSGSFVTANVTLYTKMNAIVASNASLNRLMESQRTILREAGEATVVDETAAIPDESSAAAEACEKGATIVLASEVDLAALEAAAKPVFEDLERDPETRRLIAAIGDLKLRTEHANTVVPCGPQPPSASPVPSLIPGDQSLLNGTYRLSFSEDDLRQLGLSESEARDYAGMITLELHNGEWAWSLRQEEPTHGPWLANGTYVLSGDLISARFSGSVTGPRGEDYASIEDTYRWARSGDTLVVTLLSTTGPQNYQDGLGALGGTWYEVR